MAFERNDYRDSATKLVATSAKSRTKGSDAKAPRDGVPLTFHFFLLLPQLVV